jgi:glutamate transport system substrate-binding protein
VDLVLASYSITDERRQIVGQTGPYLVTGQQVLVAADSDITGIEDLKGEEVCSASGSTSLENVEAAGAIGAPADTYSQCAEDVLNGSVEAMSTDGSILLGLAAQNEGELKVVGEEFSEENIGVGYSLESPEMCEWINGVLEESFENGDWAAAFEATLGGDDVETPEPPTLDECA